MLVAIADVQIYKYCCSLERKHANELEHPTQAPNATSNGGDASRVGVEKGRKYEFCYIKAAYFPDARRVAPIRACV